MNEEQYLEFVNNQTFIIRLDNDLLTHINPNHNDVFITSELNRFLKRRLRTDRFHWSTFHSNNDVIYSVRSHVPTILIEFRYDFKTIREFNMYKVCCPDTYGRLLQERLKLWRGNNIANDCR